MFMYVCIAIAIAVIACVIMIYNDLIAKIESVNNSKTQIDVQLDSRFKIYENMVAVVKESMKFEHTALAEIIQMRSHAQNCKAKGNVKEQLGAEDKITQLGGLLFEAYPELNSLKQARDFQEEIATTEGRLRFARQAYNDSVEIFNSAKNSFFTSIVVGLFKSKLDKDFEYWQLSEEKKPKFEDHTVSF